MCMVYFIASARSLPPIEWHAERPSMHVGAVSESESTVVGHFPDAQMVSYVGSHLHCGCGFRCETLGAEPEDASDIQRSHDDLATYLTSLPADAGPIHIYGCWSGDEAEPTEHLRTVAPDRLRDPDFEFRERELLTVLL